MATQSSPDLSTLNKGVAALGLEGNTLRVMCTNIFLTSLQILKGPLQILKGLLNQFSKMLMN